jgi:hypothetical protein
VDLKELESGVEPASHWYYQAKAALLKDVVGRGLLSGSVVWDVGAGSGYFSNYLLASTAAAAAICIDPNYSEESTVTLAGKEMRFRCAPEGASPDLVLMMDVLEHVDDPITLVRDYAARAKPRSLFFVTVPAHQWLWSPHDVYLDHRMRYSTRTLAAVLEGGGLEVKRLGYYYLSILPAVLGVRLLNKARYRRASGAPESSDLGPSTAVTNRILERILAAERYLLRLNRMAGVSVVALAQVPETAERPLPRDR